MLLMVVTEVQVVEEIVDVEDQVVVPWGEQSFTTQLGRSTVKNLLACLPPQDSPFAMATCKALGYLRTRPCNKIVLKAQTKPHLNRPFRNACIHPCAHCLPLRERSVHGH